MIEMVTEHLVWGELAAIGMLMGGLGGGAFLVSAIASLIKGNKYWDLMKFGAYLAAPAVIIDVILLAAELGHPERAIAIYSNPQSMITIGSSILAIFIVIGLIYITFLTPDSLPWLKTWFPWCKHQRARNVIAIIGIPFAVGTSYTGLLLSGMASKPIWSTPTLPILFFFSAVLTGLMAIGLLLSVIYRTKLVAKEQKFLHSTISKVAIAGVAFCIINLALALQYASATANMLLTGSLSAIFVGGFIVVGLVIPIVLCLAVILMRNTGKVSYTIPTLMIVSSIMVLLGNPLMRYAILAAGQLMG